MSELPERADDEALYRAFVGPRGEAYYLAYFARADARGYAPIAWHWPALGFGLLWFLYRRLNLWALVVFLVPNLVAALAVVAEQMLPGSGEWVTWTLLVGFLIAWLPLQANAIYYRHARSAIDAARRLHPGDRATQIAALHAAGGVNPRAPILFVVGLLVASMLLGTLVAP